MRSCTLVSSICAILLTTEMAGATVAPTASPTVTAPTTVAPTASPTVTAPITIASARTINGQLRMELEWEAADEQDDDPVLYYVLYFKGLGSGWYRMQVKDTLLLGCAGWGQCKIDNYLSTRDGRQLTHGEKVEGKDCDGDALADVWCWYQLTPSFKQVSAYYKTTNECRLQTFCDVIAGTCNAQPESIAGCNNIEAVNSTAPVLKAHVNVNGADWTQFELRALYSKSGEKQIGERVQVQSPSLECADPTCNGRGTCSPMSGQCYDCSTGFWGDACEKEGQPPKLCEPLIVNDIYCRMVGKPCGAGLVFVDGSCVRGCECLELCTAENVKPSEYWCQAGAPIISTKDPIESLPGPVAPVDGIRQLDTPELSVPTPAPTPSPNPAANPTGKVDTGDTTGKVDTSSGNFVDVPMIGLVLFALSFGL